MTVIETFTTTMDKLKSTQSITPRAFTRTFNVFTAECEKEEKDLLEIQAHCDLLRN